MGGSGGRLRRVDVRDDATMQVSCELLRRAYTADHPDDPLPTAAEMIANARADEAGQTWEYWLLREGDEPVAMFRLLLALLDNLDHAELDLAVDPAHQRRGYGRSLLGHALGRISQLGRHRVTVAVNEPADGGTNRAMRFAAAAGWSRSLSVARRSLDLAALDTARLDRLRAEAQAASSGYQLVSWTDPCPDDLVDDFAYLNARMSTDAPMGDLGIEAEHWDRDRVRQREATIRDQGRTHLVTAARFGRDGPLVAFTDLATSRHDPGNAFQWASLVVTEHRGHRLGVLVKLANLDRLRAVAPQARLLHTWNADVNSHMIAINEAMGFRAVQRESMWRIDLPGATQRTGTET